tara:strand:+ start:3008 stop:4099 length:1092 start_codon:yes stop_codon:yes gene_type:complete
MNINKVLALCLSPDQGGLELYFLKLVKYYRNIGLYMHVGCSMKSHISEKITDHKVECHEQGIFRKIKNFFLLRRYIIKNNLNILHISWAKDILLAVLLKLLTPGSIKIIFYRQMKISRPKKDLYHRFIYKHIDVFLVITEKLKNEAYSYLPLPKRKIKKLTYGIEIPLPDSIINKNQFFNSNNIDPEIFSIGVFSRIEEQKGQHLVLDAINQINHKIQLCIIGHSMCEKYKNRLTNDAAKYKLSDYLRFIKFVESPMSYMPFFDLIILPTYEETFGLIVAEAMLMKVPVIGSNAGGVPEIISEGYNGLLFETRNSNDLSKKINIFLENITLRDKFVSNGYSFANKEYNYKQHFDRLEKIINSL